ncbi:cystathionine gamma-synthase [Cohaesibacter marisflavi]|uniref:L-methionine gamma-lyase n=1 Tax=Cohaesibacter marisflavi TaxID=655353 RepID=A0A1I5ND44_9HYPH|nr:cystathionine gamma-synthase [Cohaesibacter marisflavi]SFP19713.1 cystathionine gamma-synthase [Cohaesibacter marisflavi]
MKKPTEKPQLPKTIAAAYGVACDSSFGAVSPPLYLSSTYEFSGYDQPRAFDYGRAGNPTRALAAEAIAALEGGAGAVMTSSGLAAIDLLVGRLPVGAKVVIQNDCYGGTLRLLKAREKLGYIQLIVVDFSDLNALEAAIKKGPSLLFIETPSNPLMRVFDIAVLSSLAKRYGAKTVVDNTFLSPALQQPLSLGADYVVHSTTKFLNGHSDVVAGALVALNDEDCQELNDWSNITGAISSPFDSWLTLRGIRTLFARMEQQEKNAMTIANHLNNHGSVSKVYYPGLTTHPNHELAKRQQQGFGAMLSFEHKDGETGVRKLVETVKTFTLAESLGGVESLIAHPATMTHADMGAEARKAAGISDGLLRLSVGLEHISDLIEGLDAGLS